MRHSYRISGIDKASGLSCHQTVRAKDAAEAWEKATRLGMMVDGYEQLTSEFDEIYVVLFAVLKTLTLFAAIGVTVLLVFASNTILQQIFAIALGCFLGILARVFQAEEKSHR